jgi:DNA-binding NarL/FixJ family response regulator
VGTNLDVPGLSAAARDQGAQILILDEEWAVMPVLKTLVESEQHPAVVVIAHRPKRQSILRLINGGVAACLSTDTSPADICSALRLAAAGEQVLMSEAGARGKRPIRDVGIASLTRRERDVLKLIEAQQSRAAIALALHISEETVNSHTKQIFRKLGVSRRTELFRFSPD